MTRRRRNRCSRWPAARVLRAALSLSPGAGALIGREDGRLRWLRRSELSAGRTIRGAMALTEIAAGKHTVALTGERLLPLPAPARNGQLPLRPGERLLGFADWQS